MVGRSWWIGLLSCLSIFAMASESSAQFYGRFRGPFGGPFGGPLGPPLPIGPRLGLVPAVPVAPGVVATPFGLTAVAPIVPVIPIPPVRSVYYGSGYYGGVYGTDVRVGANGSVSVRTPGFSFDSTIESPVAPIAPVGYVEPTVDMAVGSLQAALIDLTRSLEARQDGETWINYLKPELLALAIEGWASSRSYASAEQLQRAIVPFEGIAANPELAWISSMPGFVTVVRGVRAILGDESQEIASGALPPSSQQALPNQPSQGAPEVQGAPAVQGSRGNGSPTLAPAPESAIPAAGQRSQPEDLPPPVPQNAIDT